MTTDYEILLMLDPELPEERQTEIVTRAREAIERDGGTWDRHEPWGRRRLAYEIDHKVEGVYVLFDVTAESAVMDELDRSLRLADDVIRHKIVRVPRHAGGRVRPPAAVEEAAAGPARTS